MRGLFTLILGDVRERVRRRSFLATLGGALYLGYAAVAGNIVMRLDDYRGVYNSAWVGTLIALSTSLFVSLIGFYIVKNSIDRDRITGVGQILAATPLGRHAYLAAKWLSNFAVLGTIVAVQLAAAVAMQLLKGEAGLDLLQLAAPSVFLTLPAMLFVAALAVLFESARWLRGGFGNVVYFFAWAPFIVVPMELGIKWFDLFGLSSVQDDLQRAVAQFQPGYAGGFSLSAGPAEQAGQLKTFVWNGIPWSGTLLLQRAAWIAYAIVPLALAALFFDRFDSRARQKQAGPRGPAARKRAEWRDRVLLRPLARWSPRARLLRLVVAELRLMIQGVSFWWFAAALAFIVLCLTLPLDAVQENVLPLAWFWPVLLWSPLGVREDRFGVSQILFSAPDFAGTQFAALALAGVIFSFVTGSGALVRFALAGEAGSLVSFAGGALFVPALAICLGVWSRNSRTFEACYTILWYVGPMNRVPGLDFAGASPAARAGGYGVIFFVVGLVLLLAGYAGRKRQIAAL